MTTMTMPADIDMAAMSAAVNAALAAADQPQPAPAPKQPNFHIPKVEAHPTLMQSIVAAVEKVLTGNHKATVAKRKALIDALATELVNAPLYGVEVDGANLPIGDPIDLGNARIEVDGHGRAVSITVDSGTPIWDA